jgi:hypothetical protein
MKATISTNFEQERFQRWLRNVLRTSKREVSVVVQEQFRGVIKEAFRLTPPMADTTFAKGFSAAKKSIKRDTTKAFYAVSEGKGVLALKRKGLSLPSGGVSAALSWYKSHQTPSKRPKVEQKRFILKSELEHLRNRLIQDIGITAAGWVKAATELNVKPAAPDWVQRHTGRNPGQYTFNVSNNQLAIMAKNTAKHSASSYIQTLLDRAFFKQTTKMRLRIINALKNKRVDPNAIEWGRRIS